MRTKRSACLIILLLLWVFGVSSFPGLANSSILCDSPSYSFSETENYSPDFIFSFLNSSSLELGKFTPTSFVHYLLLAGGGGSGYKGGSKSSGKGYGYEGSKGSGGSKGSKGSGGYKNLQGKTGSTSSKGAEDELKMEKDETSPPVKELTPLQVNH